MATALAKSLLEQKVVLSPEQLIASDSDESQRNSLSSQLGIRTTSENSEIVRESDLLVLAVKPKDVAKVLEGIRESFEPRKHLLVSVAAGIRIGTLENVGKSAETA